MTVAGQVSIPTWGQRNHTTIVAEGADYSGARKPQTIVCVWACHICMRLLTIL